MKKRPAYITLRSQRLSKGGFTLVELLTVLVIIAILAALTVGAAKHVSSRSTEARIRAEIKSLEVGLDAYKLDKGSFPTAVAVPRTDVSQARANSKKLYQALSGNIAGTGLAPDPGNRSYFPTINSSKNGNVKLDSDNKYYFVDALGTPYNYISGDPTIQSNKFTFDLWSFGLDVQSDTVDDLANWKF